MGRASAHAASSRNGRTGISFGGLCALPRNQKRGRSLTCIAGVCAVCIFFPTIGQLGSVAWFGQHFRYSLAQATQPSHSLVAVAIGSITGWSAGSGPAENQFLLGAHHLGGCPT